MVSDSSEWWNKYYKGNTRQYLDTLLSAKFSANPDKSLDIAKRQIYDSLPLDIKWNQPAERSGTAYAGIVLDYFTPTETLPSVYGAQFVPDSEPVTVEPITPVTTVHPQDEHIVTLSSATTQIISNIESGILIIPQWFFHNVEWVKGGQITENDFLTSYHNLVNQNIIHEAMAEPEPEPEQTWSGWVTKPSGIIEYMTMTVSTKQTLEGQGWIFTTDKPVTPQPENENISVIFYTGTGGDLKTHFGINSIIVTPEEKEELAGWLYQNYGTSIILAVNRLTNDIRTHTAQQVKAYVLQKIQDDTPQEVLPTPTTPTTPPTVTSKSGIMGAGVAGAIALLILGGFIIDSRRKK